jgi:hypothetical protein
MLLEVKRRCSFSRPTLLVVGLQHPCLLHLRNCPLAHAVVVWSPNPAWPGARRVHFRYILVSRLLPKEHLAHEQAVMGSRLKIWVQNGNANCVPMSGWRRRIW